VGCRGCEKITTFATMLNRKQPKTATTSINALTNNYISKCYKDLLFCWQKSKQKTMSAESASLKIGYTSLKIRNLSPFHCAFKQTDFLRSVLPIFLTLTSQGGNQGIAKGDG